MERAHVLQWTIIKKILFYFQENIHFHKSYEELHKHVDPSILPKEFGGTAGPFENTNIQNAILQFEDYFQELKNMAADNKGKH